MSGESFSCCIRVRVCSSVAGLLRFVDGQDPDRTTYTHMIGQIINKFKKLTVIISYFSCIYVHVFGIYSRLFKT